MVAHQLAIAVSAILAGVASGVTFTAEFEKTIGAQLATLKQEVDAYPDLLPVFEGVPRDVAGWKALSLEETVAKLRLFSSQKADELPLLYALDRENTAAITKFANDGHELVMKIAAFLEADEDEDEESPVALQGASDAAASAPLASTPKAATSPVTPAESTKTTPATTSPMTGGTPPAATVPSAPSSAGASSASAVSSPSSAGASTTTAASKSSPTELTQKSGGISTTGVSAASNVQGSLPSSVAKTAVVASVAQPASTNAASVGSSVTTFDAFSGNSSTSSSSSDGSSDIAAGSSTGEGKTVGNNAAAALSDVTASLPTPESSASRSVFSALVATAVAVVAVTVV